MKETISCRRARRQVQNLLDRVGPLLIDSQQSMSKHVPRGLRAHLQCCPKCDKFLRSLASMAPALRDQLDRALLDHPPVPLPALLRERAGARAEFNREAERGAGTVADRPAGSLRRLFAPIGRPSVIMRWAAVSFVGVLLLSLIALRIHSSTATNRLIQAQVDGMVELIYREPLLADVESALLRTRPTMSDYVDDLNRAAEPWNGEQDSEFFLN